MDFVAFSGRALHSGEKTCVRLCRRPGPLAFAHGERELVLSELEVLRADRGVALCSRSSGFELDLVEHLLAALAGVGVRSGIAIAVSGGEVPLLDGGSLELARAVLALDPPRVRPALRVVSDGELSIGRSRYVFEKCDALELAVEVDFTSAGLGLQRARWGGSSAEFLREIAPARTFGFESDAAALSESGRARWVDPGVVMVFDRSGQLLAPGLPAGPEELARHKLLDLIGDAALFGGPPIGKLFAERPGHAANHRAFEQALSRGLIARL